MQLRNVSFYEISCFHGNRNLQKNGVPCDSVVRIGIQNFVIKRRLKIWATFQRNCNRVGDADKAMGVCNYSP